MSPEKEALLASRHPSYVASSLQEGGAACGDGWFDIVDQLLTAVERLDGVAAVVQVKQKVGRLRVYVDGADPEVIALTLAAEAGSATVCEVCGEPGVLRRGRQVATRCVRHRRRTRACTPTATRGTVDVLEV